MAAARVVVAVALALACARVARADNPSLARAKAALEKSDYPGAQEAVAEALADGSSGPAELAEIYRVSGIVAAALDNAKAATVEFERLLALDPKATLPAGTSPKITRPFETAQAEAAKRGPLKIGVTTAAAPPAVTIAIQNDPRGMIARVRAIVRVDGGAEQPTERAAAPRLTIDLPAKGRRIDVRVAALDAHGNRLAEVGSADVPLVIVGETARPTRKTPPKPPPEPEQPRGPRPLYAKWWLWGGVAIVFAGAGGTFGFLGKRAADDLEALNADSANHQFTEAQDLESRARRHLLFANIGFGIAGASAIAATILFVTEPARPAERRTAIRPVPTSHGGGVVLEVPF